MVRTTEQTLMQDNKTNPLHVMVTLMWLVRVTPGDPTHPWWLVRANPWDGYPDVAG